MPTNANTFNSRVTSEALEKKFRDTFPSQGGAELVQDLFAQGVIVPTVDFTSAAQGTELRSDLQVAWDFATGHNTVQNTNTNIISNTGFWQIDLNMWTESSGSARNGIVRIGDGLGFKNIWEFNAFSSTTAQDSIAEARFNVFLRAGDVVNVLSSGNDVIIDVWYRQIADVSGNLVNPLGFVSS